MIYNSGIPVSFVGKSHLLKDKPSDKIDSNLLTNYSPETKQQPVGQYNFLKRFWKRLVLWPLSFPQNPSTKISSFLEEDTNLLASDSIRLVLSNNLELPMNSKELSEVINNSFKIFHEDYPGDFILEYKGERLGMMMLDKCLKSNGEEKLIYRFQPNIKSFRGLF